MELEVTDQYGNGELRFGMDAAGPDKLSERRRQKAQKLQVLSRARIQSEEKLAGADCIDKVGWAT